MKAWIERPVSEPPEKEDFYTLKSTDGGKWGVTFYSPQQGWYNHAEYLTHYLVPAEGNFLTDAEIEKIASDAWDAATERARHEHTKYRDAFDFALNDKIIPTKTKYLKSIKHDT